MDFDSASKRYASEVKRRRDEGKRKLDERKNEEDLAAHLEEEQRIRREECERREEERREEEVRIERLTMGIRYHQQLKVVPTGRPDDKVLLPPSCLEELERQAAWDRVSDVLTFRLQCPTGVTHCGVAEFTAQEGTIGIGVKVILSLGEPPDAISVRFVALPRYDKIRVVFQPRGAGFHGNADVVSLDLKQLLERTLNTHTTLTEHDTIMLRHANQDFYLLATKLEPETALVVLNTEMEVELSPSEAVEAEQKKKEKMEQTRLERERLREAEIERRREVSFPSGEGVKLTVRLPTGGSVNTRFPVVASVENAYQWLIDHPDCIDITPPFGRNFELVQSWPGHRLVLPRSAKALDDYGLLPGRNEALLLQPIGDVVGGDVEQPSEELWSPRQLAGQWSSAAVEAASSLDAAALDAPEMEDNENHQVEQNSDMKVAIFHKLKDFAPDFPTAAKWAQRWASELAQCEEMGYTVDRWPAAVRLLEKYQGRLVRVVNGLAEEMDESEG